MSRANVEVVERMYAAFHGGESDVGNPAVESYFAEDVFVDVTTRVDGGTGRGREAVARLIGEWLEMFDDWHEEIERLHDLGDRVCAVAVQRGRGKDSGIEIQTRYAVLYELDGGQITRMTLYGDPDEALRAAAEPAA